jgi:hypothetical protein
MAQIGPLHLLPPVALTALLLVTDKDKATNMCVMLWAYIDKIDGRLLEAGLERTIISSPRTLYLRMQLHCWTEMPVLGPCLTQGQYFLWPKGTYPCGANVTINATKWRRSTAIAAHIGKRLTGQGPGYFFNCRAHQHRIMAIIMAMMADERPGAPWN